MKIIFSQEERDRLLQTLLNEEQRRFLAEHIRRGKQTAFARELARAKGVHITDSMSDSEIERFVDDWLLVDFIDAGPNYADQGYKCECGRTLRYVYIVRHKQTGERVQFGKEHFEEHTQIPTGTVKGILQSMEAIDYEQDELLHKLHDKWSLDRRFPMRPADFSMPEEMASQLALGLPLLDRQIRRLETLLSQYRDERESRPPVSRRNSPEADEPLESPQPDHRGIEQVHFEEEGAGQFAFDFGQFASTPATSEPPTVGRTSISTSAVRMPSTRSRSIDSSIVLTYINEGMQSARAIAELLIARHGYTDERYITGKPKLYGDLCRELERLAAAGDVELVHVDPGHQDRLYQAVSRKVAE